MSGLPRRAVLLVLVLAGLPFACHAAPPLQRLQVPAGFHVSIYSD